MAIKRARYRRRNKDQSYDTYYFQTDVSLVNGLEEFIKSQSHNFLKREQAYALGDVAFTPTLPTWARLDCTAAGITGASEPAWGTIATGKTIADGTVTWTVRDVKNALYAP